MDAKPQGIIEYIKEHNQLPPKVKDISGLDLEGVDLSGADLSLVNCENVDLRNATLNGTIFFKANLKNALLSGADLSDADLTGADLSCAHLDNVKAHATGFGAAHIKNASFFEADLHASTFTKSNLMRADFRCADMTACRLREADLRGADFTEANLQHADLSLTRVAKARFDNADLRHSRLRSLIGYEAASWIGADIRDINFAGGYLLRRFIMDQNYLKEFREKSVLTKVIYWLWLITSDCGRSMLRWVLWTAVITFFFAWLYTQVGIDYGRFPTPISPLYFSVVTLTTLGYGDVVPKTLLGQVVAMFEVMTGYLMLGGLLSILANKMARRSE